MLLRLLERLLRHGNNKTLGRHLRPKRHVLPGKGAAGGFCGRSVPWGPNHITLQGTFASGANQRGHHVQPVWAEAHRRLQRHLLVHAGAERGGDDRLDTRNAQGNATAHVDTYSTLIGGLCDGNPAKHPRFSFVTRMQTQ